MSNPFILIARIHVKEGKVEDTNVPFRHFKTTEVGYIREKIFNE